MLRIVVLVLAVAAGGAAAWLATGSSGAAPVMAETRLPAPAAPVREVLVAAVDVAPGTMVEAASLRWQPWPEDALNEAFILRGSRPDAPELLAGMIVRTGLVAGEPVQDAKLSTGNAGILSVMLDAGRRAVAVRINAENTAGGLIVPDDRVDVLHTTTRQVDGQSAASSRVILRNVRVLAIDQTIDNASGAVVGKTATLELGPDEVALVTAAEASGALSLALRALVDNDETLTPVAEAASSRKVRIFRAGQEETVEVRSWRPVVEADETAEPRAVSLAGAPS